MNWVKKYKLLAIKSIQYDSWSCLELKDLWQALHSLFNSAQSYQINLDLLDKILNKPVTMWIPFSEEEFKSLIIKYSNLLTLGPNKLSWRHLKVIINNSICLKSFINITNVCINLGHWLSHFKMFNSIITSKPNKAYYDSSKIFRPIILLNTLGKLIEKVIGERIQLQSISKNFIHPC